MLLTYDNLTIRNATPEDAQLLCQWWNNGTVMAHAGFPNGLNTNIKKVAQSLAFDSDETYRRLIIEVSNIPIGEMSFHNKDARVAEIGVKICDQSMQGKGYGTLFLKMLISGLFAMGYYKIVLDTNLSNTRAQHVYESLGFQKLRVNQNSWINQLGVSQSSVEYELQESQCTFTLIP